MNTHPIIDLVPGNLMRWLGPIVVAFALCLVICSPVDWPWRVGAALATAITGGLLWKRFLVRFPRAIVDRTPDSLEVRAADGGNQLVEQVRLGVVRPWLISARLYLEHGAAIDLFLPGGLVPAEDHWRLRRALIQFRPQSARAD